MLGVAAGLPLLTALPVSAATHGVSKGGGIMDAVVEAAQKAGTLTY